MKRIISCFILIAMLILGLSLTAFADSREFIVSEDYKTIILDGVTYIRTNTACMSFWELIEYDRDPDLTEQQKEELIGTSFNSDPQRDILDGYFCFKDGATLNASYIREGYLEEFLYWTSSEEVEYEIDFFWPDGNTVPVTVEQLKGTPVTLESRAWSWGDTFDVALELENESRYVQRGLLVVEKNQYYYIDYAENQQLGLYGYFDLSEVSSIDAYKVTDTRLLNDLQQAKEDSEHGTQILSSNSFGNTLSAIMMSLLFGVIPLGMIILTGILTLRSKGSYRVIWGSTAGLASVTLLIYIGFVIQFLVR